jgi:hypothetical protein
MTPLPTGQTLALQKGALLSLADHVPQLIEAVDGALWITQSDILDDIVLEAGESIEILEPERALLSALGGPAKVRVSLAQVRRLAEAA